MSNPEFHFSLGYVDWRFLVGLVGSALLAAFIHFVVFAVVRRVSRKTGGTGDDELIRAVYQPSRWILVLLVLMTGAQAARIEPQLEKWWSIVSAMAMAALVGWIAMRVLRALRNIVEAQNDITVEDNLTARRRTTRMRIFNRVAQTIILFMTISFMLLAIPAVRAVGVTLVASAGLAALAIGAAAQPALKNLIAGIQMAFTEPIRIDDVVIVEGEWGKIEDIRLTYVIVHIWDDRRLVVPVSYFLEKPFQNWTRETSHLIGMVFIYVDHSADVEALRQVWIDAVQSNPRWDGRIALLQVTDHKPDAMELRGLLSARNAPDAWDFRCEAREAMMTHLREHMPEAMVRDRVRLEERAKPEKTPGVLPGIG
ncbi:MAG: mechanosensitive ion channel [Sphingobium sp.]